MITAAAVAAAFDLPLDVLIVRKLGTPRHEELVCLETPEPFGAIGDWYADFAQVSDDEVVQALDRRSRIAA